MFLEKKMKATKQCCLFRRQKRMHYGKFIPTQKFVRTESIGTTYRCGKGYAMAVKSLTEESR